MRVLTWEGLNMTLRKYQFSRNKDEQVKHTDGFRLVRGSSQGGKCTYCFLPVNDNDLFVAKDNQWVGPFGLVITNPDPQNPVGRLTKFNGEPFRYHPMFTENA